MNKTLMTIFCITLCILTSYAGSMILMQDQTIITKNNQSLILPAGTKVEVLYSVGNSYKVLYDNQEFFINMRYLKRVSSPLYPNNKQIYNKKDLPVPPMVQTIGQ